MKNHIKLYEEYTEPKKMSKEDIIQWLMENIDVEFGYTKYDEFKESFPSEARRMIEDDSKYEAMVLRGYFETYYKINADGEVDVDDVIDVKLKHKVTEIPFQFDECTGNFNCSGCDLTSLKGVPRTIHESFDCSDCELETLEFGPTFVNGDYICHDNNLKSLKGVPKNVHILSAYNNQIESLEDNDLEVCIELRIYNNNLKTLKGIPKVRTHIFAQHNPLEKLECYNFSVEGDFVVNNTKLKNLVGGPIMVKRLYDAKECKLESLEGSPETVGTFNVSKNKLTSLVGCPQKIYTSLIVSDNKLETLEGIEEVNSIDCYDNPFYTLVHAHGHTNKVHYSWKNKKYPVEISKLKKIYSNSSYDFTLEMHVQSIIKEGKTERNIEMLKRLEKIDKPLFLELMSSHPEVKEIYAGNEELVDAYKTSVDVEGDFY